MTMTDQDDGIRLKAVSTEILGDLDTPLSIYLKCKSTNSFLLESVTGGENVARYSIIGLNPYCEVIAKPNQVQIIRENKRTVFPPEKSQDPLRVLEDTLKTYHVEGMPAGLPFSGGAMGYLSWEIIGSIEKITFQNPDDREMPLAHFLFPRDMIIMDHAKRTITIVTLVKPGQERQGKVVLDQLKQTLQSPISASYLSLKTPQPNMDKVQSNTTPEAFKDIVKKAKQYIKDGDIFQIVLSQRFEVTSPKSPMDVYRTLRATNPSPYMFYVELNDCTIIGSSPEILVKLTQKGTTQTPVLEAVVRPIAGTRPRDPDPIREAALIEELKQDEKERAEHIMLVDLGRNDLGRVCKFQSIRVSDYMSIEKYSHVMHMCTTVKGELKEGKTAFDLVRATFPAGTVSGAPKVRAIELIEELESSRRGLYAGALGYFDFNGNMDLCITIRTILSKNGRYYVQSGAGIVADSIPENEYKETQNKAKGMIAACLGETAGTNSDGDTKKMRDPKNSQNKKTGNRKRK